MNELYIYSSIKEEDLKGKGIFIFKEDEDDYNFKLEYKGYTAYAHFKNNFLCNITCCKDYKNFTKELYKLFPDLILITEDQLFYLLHIDDKQLQASKFEEYAISNNKYYKEADFNDSSTMPIFNFGYAEFDADNEAIHFFD